MRFPSYPAKYFLTMLFAGIGFGVLLPGSAPSAATCPPPPAFAGILPAATLGYIDGLMETQMRLHHVPGASLVLVRDGNVVLARGFGFANLAAKRRVDPYHTLFRIGSITKLFTYTAAFQLVDAGRLDLGADINTYLEGAPIRSAFGRPVTTKDIMAHRAGFEMAGLGYDFFGHPERVPTLREFVVRHQPQRVRSPGIATTYSNYAPTILGLAIEEISGQPYAAYIEQHVLTPLGMKHSALQEPVADPGAAPHGRMGAPLAAKASLGYAYSDGAYRTIPYEHIYPAAAPAGSMFSTAGDMACFMLSLLGDPSFAATGVVSQSSLLRMRQRQYEDRPAATDFAHGLFNIRSGRSPIFQHTGAMASFTSNLFLVPDLKLGIFVAGNSTTAWPLTSDTPRLILEHLEPGFFTPARTAVPANARPLSAFAGHYLVATRSYTHLEKILELASGEVHVAPDGKDLLRITFGFDARSWRRIDTDLFESMDGIERIQFVADEKGAVVRLYNALGHKAYDRIPYWRTSLFLANTLRAVMALAFLTLLIAAAGGHRRASFTALDHLIPWGVPLISVFALGICIYLLQHLAAGLRVDEVAVLFEWPPLTLRRLVFAGGALIVLTALQLLVLLLVWRRNASHWTRLQQALLSLSMTAAVTALASWNLFAPAST